MLEISGLTYFPTLFLLNITVVLPFKVKGVRFKKSIFGVYKVHVLGVPHLPKINPGYGSGSFVCPSVRLFVCLLGCLFVCLSVGLFVCWVVCLFVCLFIYLFVWLFVGLFVCLFNPARRSM